MAKRFSIQDGSTCPLQSRLNHERRWYWLFWDSRDRNSGFKQCCQRAELKTSRNFGSPSRARDEPSLHSSARSNVMNFEHAQCAINPCYYLWQWWMSDMFWALGRLQESWKLWFQDQHNGNVNKSLLRSSDISYMEVCEINLSEATSESHNMMRGFIYIVNRHFNRLDMVNDVRCACWLEDVSDRDDNSNISLVHRVDWMNCVVKCYFL
jgi:hypothetical protein